MGERVAMLVQRRVQFDARVRRAADALAASGREVVVVEVAGTPSEARGAGWRLVTVPELRAAARLGRPAAHAAASVRLWHTVRALRPDVVHAHDLAMLPAGRALRGAWPLLPARRSQRRRPRLVYDAHELYTGVAWRSAHGARAVGLFEDALARGADAVITVSPGIAERLRRRLGPAARIEVVRNLVAVQPPNGAVRPGLRERLGLTADVPLVVHHGSAAASRGAAVLAAALAHLPETHAVFIGADDRELAALRRTDRIHVLPPQPLDRLLGLSREADVGVALSDLACENHRLALPNKVFEYLAAGIPVVASRGDELVRLLEGSGAGWTVDPADPADVARGIRSALDARGGELSARVRALHAAHAWDAEKQVLLRVYDELA